MPTINELDDDCLLAVFARLNVIDKLCIRSVCRRWRLLSDSYNLYHHHQALGTVVCVSCFDRQHHVYPKDIIDRLFSNKNSSRSVFKGKFDVKNSSLKVVLTNCPDLLSLVLKFSRSIDDETIALIAAHCPKLVHLDFSLSVLASGVVQAIGDKLPQLTHINILGCEAVTEEELGELLRRCTQLEEFTFGRHGSQVSGRFLTLFASDVKNVSIYGIDELLGGGVAAITSLASGRGAGTEHLKLKGEW